MLGSLRSLAPHLSSHERLAKFVALLLHANDWLSELIVHHAAILLHLNLLVLTIRTTLLIVVHHALTMILRLELLILLLV